jgi:DNA-binding transcriptional MocR family regulator
MTSVAGNWEQEQLEASLSRRVRAGWGAYWVAGARQEPPPVPPIALTGGIPDPDSLPTEELIACSDAVLRREGPEALRYGGHQGHEQLREWLAGWLGPRDGLSLTPNNFTMTNGVSGAMINVCDTFLDEGDVGLSELPSFPGGAGNISHCLADLVGVPLDAEGLIPEALEETIVRLKGEGRRVKLLYTVPNFQNPTGSMLALDRRQQVVDICQRHEVLIVEDEAYADIRFESERLPSLFGLARGNYAVQMGTFSKTVATGLRVGWVLADEKVIEGLLRTRYDLGTSPWVQRVMHEFASSGRFDKHVAKVNAIYRSKRDVMLSALEERCSRYASWNRPLGGYFLWMDLAESVDPSALAEAARSLGVAFVGGRAFYPDGQGRGNIRLAFSFVNEQEIPEAIQRLGRALEQAASAPAK